MSESINETASSETIATPSDDETIATPSANETIVTPRPAPVQEEEEVVDNAQVNTERFYQVAEENGLSHEQAMEWFDIVMEDDIFDGGVRGLSGLIFDDIDGNGKGDMVIMVQETNRLFVYGTGALYFYMNQEESYCFDDEDFPYFGVNGMNICYADLNGDGNVEIAFALQVKEYLYGEGGIAHGVGGANFVLVWDEQDNGSVADWWVD